MTDYYTRNARALAMSVFRGCSCEEAVSFCGCKPTNPLAKKISAISRVMRRGKATEKSASQKKVK